MIGILLYVACSITIGRIYYATTRKTDGDDLLAVMFAFFWPLILIALPITLAAILPMLVLSLLITWRNK